MMGGGGNAYLVKIRQMNKILGFLHDEHSLEFFIIGMDESWLEDVMMIVKLKLETVPGSNGIHISKILR